MPEEGFSFLSPEAFIVLPFAILIDLIGIILIFFGLDDFWITDIIAFSFFGGWGYFRSIARRKEKTEMPSVGEKRKAVKEIKQTKKAGKVAKWGKRLKFLELIPYVGVLPFWTVSVYLELKSS